MNADDFETQLQRQPMRPIPADWKEEILRTARSGSGRSRSAPPFAWQNWWRELLWPCPQAWISVAVVWVVILLLNVTSPNPTVVTVRQPGPPSPELMMALRAQQRLFAELIGIPQPVSTPDRPRGRPRSELWPTDTAHA